MFGVGDGTNKLKDELDKTLNNNIGSNLFNIAFNNDKTTIDGNNIDRKEFKNSTDLANAYPDAKYKIKNIVTSNGYSNVEFGIEIDYAGGKGEGRKTAMLYQPYTGSSNDAVLGQVLDRMIEKLNPTDAGRIKAIKDNVATRFLQVDHVNTGSAGMSATQRNQIDRARNLVLDSTIINNKQYKDETELFNNSKKATILVDNDNYHRMMYQDGNTPTVLSADRLFRMQSVKSVLNAGTMGTIGYSDQKSINNNFVITNSNNINKAKATQFIQEVQRFSQMIDQGLIKVYGLGPEEQKYFREFQNLMQEQHGALDDNFAEKLAKAKSIYNAIDKKQVGVKNKTLLF